MHTPHENCSIKRNETKSNKNKFFALEHSVHSHIAHTETEFPIVHRFYHKRTHTNENTNSNENIINVYRINFLALGKKYMCGIKVKPLNLLFIFEIRITFTSRKYCEILQASERTRERERQKYNDSTNRYQEAISDLRLSNETKQSGIAQNQAREV